jgi:hypothetical protein
VPRSDTAAGDSTQRLARVDVEVEVLRILVLAKVREDSTGTLRLLDLSRNFTHDREHPVEERCVRVSQVGERRHMPLGNYNDVNRPEGSGVMEGKYVFCFQDDVHGRAAAQRLITVEVPRHIYSPPPTQVLTCARLFSLRVQQQVRPPFDTSTASK